MYYEILCHEDTILKSLTRKSVEIESHVSEATQYLLIYVTQNTKLSSTQSFQIRNAHASLVVAHSSSTSAKLLDIYLHNSHNDNCAPPPNLPRHSLE